MGRLFRHHYTIKGQEKMSPLQFKSKRRVEGETFKEETPQEEGMDASSEKVLMQKILECVEVQVEVLKKIISHLSKIEEEEDDEDKASYGQSELTQEDINCMMTEGKVRLLLPNLCHNRRGLPDHGLSRGPMSMTSLNQETREYEKIMIG